jgi:nucleoside phosphorylase
MNGSDKLLPLTSQPGAETAQGHLFGFPLLRGHIEQRPVLIAITGVGKTNAAMISTLFISQLKPTRLLYTGTAARVIHTLRTGDIILGKKTVHHDFGSLHANGMLYRKVIGPLPRKPTNYQYFPDPELLELALAAVRTYQAPEIRANGTSYVPQIRPGIICSGDVFGMTEIKLQDIRVKLKADLVEMEGDSYPARPALIINGLGTICGALLGSPFPLTIYIGHPGWKALGARAGYSTLNGIFIALLALTGGISLISWLIPEDAGLAIVVWVGLIITVQPFTTVPPRHFITIVVGLLPALGAWVSQLAKNIIRAVGHDQSLLQPSLIELFHHQNLFLDGAFSLEQGFIYTATIWSAMVYYIVERRFRLAAIWSALASMLSLVGMMHAWKFTNGDTALNIPLLDWLAGEPVAGGWENLVPAWPFAVAYAFIAGLLLFTHRFGIPAKTDGH